MKNKKKAFTLAEVLVTMGIIGVVAAMTVPNLVKNYQNQALVTALHKFYTEFSQAIQLYMSDQKVETLTETDLYNNNANLQAFINNYFKIVSRCGNSYTSNGGAKCFSSDQYYSINSDNGRSLSSLTCNGLAFTLASGAAVCAETSAAVPLYFEVDVNGAQAPNTFGRDFFAIWVNNNGELYDKNFQDNNKTTNFSKDVGSQTGAFGRIMNDGWKMNY